MNERSKYMHYMGRTSMVSILTGVAFLISSGITALTWDVGGAQEDFVEFLAMIGTVLVVWGAVFLLFVMWNLWDEDQ